MLLYSCCKWSCSSDRMPRAAHNSCRGSFSSLDRFAACSVLQLSIRSAMIIIQSQFLFNLFHQLVSSRRNLTYQSVIEQELGLLLDSCTIAIRPKYLVQHYPCAAQLCFTKQTGIYMCNLGDDHSTCAACLKHAYCNSHRIFNLLSFYTLQYL